MALAAAQATAQVTKPSARRTPDSASQIASLDGVAWEGAGVRLDQLKGKTVVVVTYVTWCPICNKWAPELLSSLNQAIKDKPVVVLAISTDTPPAKAKEFMDRAGLAGPNVLNGYDPNLAKSFGFENEFYNYAVVGPTGEMTDSGNFGHTYETGGKKHSSVQRELEPPHELGKLQFIDADMSPELKEMLWPMELGFVADVQRSLKRAEKTLKSEDRALLKATTECFLDDELKAARTVVGGRSGPTHRRFGKSNVLVGEF